MSVIAVGSTTPLNARAPGAASDDRVRPRRLGHVVLGTTDPAATRQFFVEGIGFKISDIAAHMAGAHAG